MSKVFAVPAAFLVLALFAVVVTGATAAGSENAQATTVTLSGWSSSPEENDLLTAGRRHVREDASEHQGRLLGHQRRLPDRDDGAFRGSQPARRLLRRLEPSRRTWARQGVLAAAEQLHHEEQVQHSRSSIPSLLERVQGREDGLRLPEGLVAARDGDQHRACSTTARHEGADDLGAAPLGRPEDGVVERGAERQADLPARRLGSAAPVRLPEQGVARDDSVAGGCRSAVELLRRPDQERPCRDAGQARLRLVRRGARQADGRDHLRGQLGCCRT